MNQQLNLSEKSQQIQNMFNKISNRYDFLNRLLSCGQDIRWRNYLIKQIPNVPSNNGVFYDVACGTGDVIHTVAKKRTDFKTFYGFDISEGMLEQAKMRSNSPYMRSNMNFVLASAEQLAVQDESADCLSIAFGLRNVDNREKALAEFHRVLKPGGTLLILEFFPAQNSFLQNIFNFYFKKILPTIGGIFSDKAAYSYLPSSVSSMPTINEMTSMLVKHGFSNIESKGWLAGSTILLKCTKN